jgi:hypothetical protein
MHRFVPTAWHQRFGRLAGKLLQWKRGMRQWRLLLRWWLSRFAVPECAFIIVVVVVVVDSVCVAFAIQFGVTELSAASFGLRCRGSLDGIAWRVV